MERIDINKEYEYMELTRIKYNNRKEMGELPIHFLTVDKYVNLISFYPFNEKKEKIFKSLIGKQKIGMLNRHILSVSRQLDISQILIEKAHEISKNYKLTLEKSNNTIASYIEPDYYKKQSDRLRYKVEEYYTLLLDMIIEETDRRSDVKYMRKKKLEELYDSPN